MPSVRDKPLWLLVFGASCTFPEVTVQEPPKETPPCVVADDCPVVADPCFTARCVAGQGCVQALDEGASCNDDDPAFTCRTGGLCAECESPADCGGEMCNEGRCIPMTCGDNSLSGDETDVDCGGSCLPCMAGQICTSTEDCASGVCVDGACTTCATDVDCPLGTFCDDGVMPAQCASKLELGVVCVRDNECQSGHCPEKDFVCCDTACDGQCEACLRAKTQAGNGTCAFVTEGADPDDECPNATPLLQRSCDGSGSCSL